MYLTIIPLNLTFIIYENVIFARRKNHKSPVNVMAILAIFRIKYFRLNAQYNCFDVIKNKTALRNQKDFCIACKKNGWFKLQVQQKQQKNKTLCPGVILVMITRRLRHKRRLLCFLPLSHLLLSGHWELYYKIHNQNQSARYTQTDHSRHQQFNQRQGVIFEKVSSYWTLETH
jgi:hypothetical protein